MSLAEDIEAMLRRRGEWVSARVICALFNVGERELRTDGDRPGLCRDFAISSARGYKHVALATAEEFDRYCGGMRRHGIGEIVHVRRLKSRRARLLAADRPPLVEAATGQGVMAL